MRLDVDSVAGRQRRADRPHPGTGHRHRGRPGAVSGTRAADRTAGGTRAALPPRCRHRCRGGAGPDRRRPGPTRAAGGDHPDGRPHRGAAVAEDSHGYTLRPEVSAQLEPYLRQDWAFVAMRLTGEAAQRSSSTRYLWTSPPTGWCTRCECRPPPRTLSGWWSTRWPRTGCSAAPGVARQAVTLDFAGLADGPFTDATLKELSPGNPYLTRISTTITDPAAITADFSFTPAPNDDSYRRVIGPAVPAEPRHPGGRDRHGRHRGGGRGGHRAAGGSPPPFVLKPLVRKSLVPPRRGPIPSWHVLRRPASRRRPSVRGRERLLAHAATPEATDESSWPFL